MAAPKNWQRKVILLFKSEKRLNASKVINAFNNLSYDEMKATTITESMCDLEGVSNKPRIKDLQSHLNNLKHQFINKSELCFYHATLVVLLRRGYKKSETFDDFEALWATEADYLLDNLSLRWIISACDTFIDHSSDPTRQAILMNAVTLVNTLKVYESQKFLYDHDGNDEINPSQKQKFVEGDQPLYDGLTYFRIGNDDTLNNMQKRYKQFCQTDPFAGRVLLNIFYRLQYLDTAFYLVKSLHSDTSTWWEE